MSDASTSRVQQYIGDPVADDAPVSRDKLEEIFQDIQADLRFVHKNPTNGQHPVHRWRLPSVAV